MKRLLILLVIAALAIPRMPVKAAVPGADNGLTVYAHHVYVDPDAYHSVGNVYLVEFESLHAKDAFVAKATRLPPGVRLLHAYKYLPFVVLGGDPESVVEFARHIPGAKAVRANHKYYLERNLDGTIGPENLGDVLKLGAQTFREHGYTGKGIVIAIIDTGIRKDHPEFNYDNGTCKVIYEESFVLTIYGYDHNETNPDDGVGHGTMVAGAAAGIGKQPDGQGVAPDAALVNLKVFPSGENTFATSAGIIAAIDRAIELRTSGQVGIDVINMSLGGGTTIHYDPEIVAINAAIGHGIAVVIAAGNEGQNGIASGYVSSPGIAPLAITAGAAYNRNETIEGYSSPGPTPRLGVKPDVVAPGTGSYPCPPFVSDYLYRAASGTSFASPHVAGSVALILDYIFRNEPNVDPIQAVGYAKYTLMHTAATLKDATTNITFDELRAGAGFVNLTAAYRLLAEETTPHGIEILPSRLPVGLVYNETGAYPIEGPLFPRSIGVYIGQEITVNFTINTGDYYTIFIQLTGDLGHVLRVTGDTLFSVRPPTTTYAFKAVVNATSAGVYTGTIAFYSLNATLLYEVPVVLNVLGEPNARLLRDLEHTDRGIDTPYGQFALFAKSLVERGVAIDILTPDENFTLDGISQYDRIFGADFASGVSLSVEDAKTFIEYISRGGHAIIIVMDPNEYDLKSIGRLAYAFGIDFGTQSIQGGQGSTVNARRNDTLPFGLSGYMPMYGIPIVPMNPGVLELARYSNFVVAAASVTPQGGALLTFGTNFLFDNRAMTDQYGVNHADILANVMGLLGFDYANFVAGYAISVSGELSLGSTVSVNVGFPALRIVHNDRVESESVSNSFTIDRAGPNSLGVSFAANAPFGLVIPLRVEPTEYNPPAASAMETEIYVSENENLTIAIHITDETGVETQKFDLSVYVIKVTGPMSVKPSDVRFEGSGGDVTLYVVFTPDMFSFVFGSAKTVNITITLTIYDENYNYKTESESVTASLNESPSISAKASAEPGAIHLEVTVNDDDNEDRLVVYLDGSVVYNETVTVGQTVKIDLTAESGTHNVTVVAIDPAGNEAKRTAEVEVPAKGTNRTLIAVAAAIVAIIAILAYLFLVRKK